MYHGGNKVRVLVVDDSPFMRAAIKRMLESDPEIEVIDTAGDGLEAIEKVKRLKPDLVTLDIQMPRMDGLTALRRIMSEHPLPIIMLSSMTEDGARVTLEAMEMGAVDYLPKNIRQSSLDIIKVRKELLEKVKLIAKTWRRKGHEPKRTASLKSRRSPSIRPHHRVDVLVIGVSTGGPKALQHILPKLPGDFPVGILIVQHMPPQFTKLLAERLNQMSRIEVVEGRNGEEVRAGKAIIAPGGRHMKVINPFDDERPRIRVIESVKGTVYTPSVDLLMESAAQVYGDKVLALILTGMGNDGLKGMKAVKEKGGVTLAQDESSSVIFGMPKACIEAGVVDEILTLNEIPYRLIEIVENGR
ncbi:chemotaxis response regulator protein-glutamate methylesterase [Candidatus Poribacteria bacterium]|nr:chemotaxis response regulator protein-glutamate methylesterase [Candidatus Poribacteria bacterium]